MLTQQQQRLRANLSSSDKHCIVCIVKQDIARNQEWTHASSFVLSKVVHWRGSLQETVMQTTIGDTRQQRGQQPCIPVRLRQWAWGRPIGSCVLHAGQRSVSPQASPTGLRGSPPTCLAAGPPCSLGCPHSWRRDLQGIRGCDYGIDTLPSMVPVPLSRQWMLLVKHDLNVGSKTAG
jgi:hypothetical protein